VVCFLAKFLVAGLRFSQLFALVKDGVGVFRSTNYAMY
jgi:hypothetical protein